MINKILGLFGCRMSNLKRGSMVFIEKGGIENRDLKVVEIGVYHGSNAKRLMKYLDVTKLYLIDPYVYEITDGFNTDDDYLLGAEDIAKNKMKKYKGKVVFIKETSDKAVSKIPNEMDYIYIDGNHLYEFVKKDIENYYSKVRIGGVLAGDDAHNVQVLKAVIEFVNKEKLVLHMDKCDWWVIKGELN